MCFCFCCCFIRFADTQLFDQEIVKRSKECALTLERPPSMFLSKQDKFSQYWQMC